MGIFSRISDIISANLNDMVEGFEHPERMLKQAVREMETTIDQALQSTAKTIAGEKMVKRELEKNRQEASLWASRAKAAVDDGNDELARKAIARKQEHEKLVAALEDQLTASQQTTQKLKRQLEAMRVKLAEAKRRLATLTARKHVADLRSKVNKVSSSASPNASAFAKFDRMREKVEMAEAEADAIRELGGEAMADVDLSFQTDIDTTDAAVEAELAELKKKAKS
ncbi:MAG: PspA/IM30 family protein [Planctomycetota bacterium]|jgi:phage shock protein A